MAKLRDTIVAPAWRKWQAFWFGEVDLLPVCVFRAALGFLFFLFVMSRTNDLEMFYMNRGFIPSSYVPHVEFFGYQKSIFHHVDSLAVLTVGHYALLFSLACLTIGLFTRISAVASYFLLLMFVNRNPAVQYGVDFIGMFYFFYLMFCDSGARFSVDSWWRGKRRDLRSQLASAATDVFSTVFLRLMQIQVCIIYFYSGIAKMKGTRWWNGSAIWDVLTMEGLIRFDMSFVAYFPDVLVIFCYLILLWEMYFPVLIWTKSFRNLLIVFGCLMHVGFGFFLQIPIFGALMCSVYILFLDPALVRRGLERITGFIRVRLRRVPAYSR